MCCSPPKLRIWDSSPDPPTAAIQRVVGNFAAEHCARRVAHRGEDDPAGVDDGAVEIEEGTTGKRNAPDRSRVTQMSRAIEAAGDRRVRRPCCRGGDHRIHLVQRHQQLGGMCAIHTCARSPPAERRERSRADAGPDPSTDTSDSRDRARDRVLGRTR